VLSIDLAASEKRETGIAYFKNGKILTDTLYSDSDLFQLVDLISPKLIGIDAPLSLPFGRTSIEERTSNHFRECDLQLRKLKIRFFPVTLGPMRKLTSRGMILKAKFENSGIEVLEIFPGATFDRLKIPRKNILECSKFLSSFGLLPKNVHESDAAIGLYALNEYSKGKGILLDGKDGKILI
jgi:predicted nuclease with RNAse H fold